LNARNELKSGVEIRVLGPLEVVVDGRFIELPSAKARQLLAALVVHANEVISTDRLFEVLWGTRPPESAANTLQTYVAHLRAALEPDRALDGAAADSAQGAMLLADGDAAGAVECLRRSADLWRDANAPYERARARVLLARALHARGERGRGQGELQAARNAFESLGAGLDLSRLAAVDTAVADRA
jgi:hypothetical protein